MKEYQVTQSLFITLEGVDAAGKSSHVEAICEHIQNRTGREVIMTREPGGTPLAEQLRDLVKNVDMSVETETLLLNAGRQDHIDRVIKPALTDGKIVVCDRFTDSTYAYQGGAKGLDKDKINTLRDWVQGNLEPELTLYFDVPLEVSKSRRDSRGEADDRLEQAMDANFTSLRQAYLQLADKNPHRIIVIDGTPDITQVRQNVLQAVDRFLLNQTMTPEKSTSKRHP